jgi:hypothetical protein
VVINAVELEGLENMRVYNVLQDGTTNFSHFDYDKENEYSEKNVFWDGESNKIKEEKRSLSYLDFCNFAYVSKNPNVTRTVDKQVGENLAQVTLSVIAADFAVIEPTDVALPKWVGEGIAGVVAVSYLYFAEEGNSNYPGPWVTTYEHPSQNPIHRQPIGNDPNETPPNLSKEAKFILGGRMIYEAYDVYKQRIDQMQPIPHLNEKKTLNQNQKNSDSKMEIKNYENN